MKNKKNVVIGTIVSISVILSVMIFLGFRHSSSLANEYIIEVQAIVNEFEQSDNREVKLEVFDKLIELKQNYTNDKSIFKNVGEYKDVLIILDDQVNELVKQFKEEYEKVLGKNTLEDLSGISKEEIETNIAGLSQLIDLIKCDEILQEEEITEFANKSAELVRQYNTKLEEIIETEKAEAEAKAKAEQEAKEKAETDAKAKEEAAKKKSQSKPNTSNKPSTGAETSSGKHPSTKVPQFDSISPKGCRVYRTNVTTHRDGTTTRIWEDVCGHIWNDTWGYIEYLGDWLDER